MKKGELKELIKNKSGTNTALSLVDLAVLNGIANVTLEMNRETNDYFYKVNLNELVDKDFDVKVLTDNKWELSDNEEEIYLFL